ncbi:hypothetical protein [Caballeronia sordidicola]|uniref:Fis family transcriptional regulator n=1 Tax=Caballeronia sordidicola TaxID=196367 RepID=A0A242MXX8_CABSO|nr:hypothetical protein [Caballeronia sordidicola]OTP76245.1 hypothetical protein PAMC26577_11535 [Caballeronia sordidicola]
MNKPKKRKAAKGAAPLSRQDLLPMVAPLARSISLKNHMALAVFKTGQGNLDLASELLKTLYWAFYLSDGGEVGAAEADFMAAERALKACLIEAQTTDQWGIAEADALHMEVILQLHDRQLASMPVHRLEKAKQRLFRLMEKDGGFPSFAMERSSVSTA